MFRTVITNPLVKKGKGIFAIHNNPFYLFPVYFDSTIFYYHLSGQLLHQFFKKISTYPALGTQA